MDTSGNPSRLRSLNHSLHFRLERAHNSPRLLFIPFSGRWLDIIDIVKGDKRLCVLQHYVKSERSTRRAAKRDRKIWTDMYLGMMILGVVPGASSPNLEILAQGTVSREQEKWKKDM